MTTFESDPSPNPNAKQAAVEYYGRPENEGILNNLRDFYARYADFTGSVVPSKLVGDSTVEYPQMLCLSVDNDHHVYVARSTQHVDKTTGELGFLVAEFDPQTKATEYQTVSPRYGTLESALPGASNLTLSIDAQETGENDVATRTLHIELTPQGVYTYHDGRSESLENALYLPELIGHEKQS